MWPISAVSLRRRELELVCAALCLNKHLISPILCFFKARQHVPVGQRGAMRSSRLYVFVLSVLPSGNPRRTLRLSGLIVLFALWRRWGGSFVIVVSPVILGRRVQRDCDRVDANGESFTGGAEAETGGRKFPKGAMKVPSRNSSAHG